MKLNKIRKKAIKAFEKDFDYTVYETIRNYESKNDFIESQYFVEFLFAICPEAYVEFLKGRSEAFEKVNEHYLSKLDFSKINFNMNDLRSFENAGKSEK